MAPRRAMASLVWAGAASIVLIGLFAVVGGRAILDALEGADPVLVAATIALGLCWLFAWSLMLRSVLGTLGVGLPATRSFFVYAGAVFANNVTPFAQAGGQPISALLVSRVSGARYETSLAGVGSVEVLNVVPSISLVLVGVGYYATTVAVSDRVIVAAATAVAIVAVVVTILVVGWRHRSGLVARAAGVAAAVSARVGSRFDPVRVERDVADRADRFFEHVGRIATDRRGLATVVGLSLTGWLFQVGSLFAALAAVGHTAPVSVLLFVIPLANLAGATPLPGGLGGIEAAFVALLVTTTGIAAADATAAVIVYRAGIYWLPVVVGGTTVMATGVRTTG